MLKLWVFMWLTALSGLSTANVEKTVFIAPRRSEDSHSLLDIGLKSLSPSTPSIREHLDAEFPTTTIPSGRRSWFRLDGLLPGQRYEVRVCWLAVQPTAFTLTTYELPQVSQADELLSSMVQFAKSQSYAKANELNEKTSDSHVVIDDFPTGTTLLLAIDAAADYFTTNSSLMAHVPPVLVDIILDPYILNVLPRSLVPTVGYVVVSAIVAWVLSRYIWVQLSTAANASDPSPGNDSASKKKRA